RRVGPAQLAQQYLAAIVQNADDAIISKDLNSTIISWNPAAERMFGYAAQEMTGQSITLLIPPELASEEDDILAGFGPGSGSTTSRPNACEKTAISSMSP